MNPPSAAVIGAGIACARRLSDTGWTPIEDRDAGHSGSGHLVLALPAAGASGKMRDRR
jgi:electron transfer flavoprotein alpha subunit